MSDDKLACEYRSVHIALYMQEYIIATVVTMDAILYILGLGESAPIYKRISPQIRYTSWFCYVYLKCFLGSREYSSFAQGMYPYSVAR